MGWKGRALWVVAGTAVCVVLAPVTITAAFVWIWAWHRGWSPTRAGRLSTLEW